MKLCPCSSGLVYSTCCGLYIDSKMNPATPEILMRSRYTAYTLAKISYIKKTMRGKALMGFNASDAKRWARHVHWISLRVLKVMPAGTDKGYVEFIASFRDGTALQNIHEKSEFKRVDGIWYYVDGIQP